MVVQMRETVELINSFDSIDEAIDGVKQLLENKKK